MVPTTSGSTATGIQGSLRWHHTFIQVEEKEDKVVDARAFRTEPGFRGSHGEELLDTFGHEVAYVEGLSEKLSSAWGASADFASKGNIDHDSESSGSEDSVPADQEAMRSASAYNHACESSASQIPAAHVPAMVALNSDSATPGPQGSLRLQHTFIHFDEQRGGEAVDARAFRTEPGFRGGHGVEHMDTFGEQVAYVEGLSEKLSSTWGASGHLAGKGSIDYGRAPAGSEDSVRADRTQPASACNHFSHSLVSGPAGTSGESAASGQQGSLRWHRTFIEFQEENGQESVDARSFQTEPGFRGSRGEAEHLDTFGHEVAYVEGLSEKLSSTWGASADLASKGNVDHDSESTGGLQGSLRLQHTFIHFDEQRGDEAVDARAFRTEPGFRGSHSEERMDTFGEQVAYVEGLSEKLSSTWAATAGGAGRDTSEHDSMPSRSHGDGDEPPEFGAPVANGQYTKGMSWQELKQRINFKTMAKAHRHQQGLGAIDELRQGIGAEAMHGMPGAQEPVQHARPSGTAAPQPAAQAGMVFQAHTAQVGHFVINQAPPQGLAAAAPYPSPPASPPAVRNPGSFGHPELCLRPCLFFAQGDCSSGDSCQFCHLSHERRPAHLDKKHRELLRTMTLHTCAWLTLPVLRLKVQELGGPPAAARLVDGLAAGCGLRVPGYVEEQERELPNHKRQHRALVVALKSMSLRLLVVAVGRALGHHRPELEGAADQLLEQLRQAIAMGLAAPRVVSSP